MERLTRSHPDLSVEVRGRMELEDRLTMFEVRLRGSPNVSWAEEVRRLTGVTHVESLGTVDGTESLRVFFRGRTLVRVLRRVRVAHQFPFPVQNGTALWTVLAPRRKVQLLIEALGRGRSSVQVRSIRRGSTAGAPFELTPRQRAVLDRALAEGYFEVPREISLSQLAHRLGVAVSTLSVSLATIERKVLEQHA